MIQSNFNYLKSVLSYNKDGFFVWKKSKEKAGEVNPHNGYEKISYKRKKNYHVHTHRLVWQWFNGTVEDRVKITHKDGNILNNRIENLQCS